MRITLLLLFLSFFAKAQKDSAMALPLVGVHIGGQMPSFDMEKRFGVNLNAGAAFMYKTKTNFMFGLQAGYMFGQNVKEDVLTQLKNADGYITENQGYPADLRVTERGLGIHLTGGKVFKFLSANPNSGLFVNIGAGYLQHKINLYDAQQTIAAIDKEMKYGYDRLTAGLSLSQFVGYLYLSQNRLANFYFGFECQQAFTKSLRKLNYDTGLPDTEMRFDMLTGFRFGWILPLYKKKPNDFYYY
ncbi:MAG: hypothetical protein KF900_12490 [Bacteroidetes bacterium]|nr:hypothetical protein [Bacteroidota bacterium]